MPAVTSKRDQVRNFIVERAEGNPAGLAKAVSEEFGISRQAANKHVQQLVAAGFLKAEGKTRNRSYSLVPRVTAREYIVDAGLAEDRPWFLDVSPLLDGLTPSVLQIWHYAFTEMFNNAIEHSEGTRIKVSIEKTAASTTITISDDGVGIFRKIQRALDLVDERQAPLELAKGKYTTDPARHSGEGIFFTSRMLDEFEILSGSVLFSHSSYAPSEWIVDCEPPAPGTYVRLHLGNHTSRTTQDVFDEFATEGEWGFVKTIVPVRLAEYGDDSLISRSQARRLLSRFERFRTVVLDFSGVQSIGQAFADEVFRVFPAMHPDVELSPANMLPAVAAMVNRALNHR